jgi:hypothetical protein
MPFVLSWSLNQLGPKIRQLHQQEMQRDFRNPVPFTVNSPRWGARGYKPWVRSDKSNLEMGFWISEDGAKGQDPSRYLYPQVQEPGRGRKQVYVTRFTKALRRYGYIGGNAYMLPLKDGAAAEGLKNQYGNITPGRYTQILWAIGATTDQAQGYAKNRKKAPKKEFFLARTGNPRGMYPGIYRRRADSFNLLFATRTEPPDVTPKYDFYDRTVGWAGDYFPELVDKKLNEVMGRL